MSFVCVTSHIDGQTLFAAPDTAPNYRGYQHIEECLNAGYRVSLTQKTGLDSIWMDTVIREMKEKLLRDRPNELITRRPKPVIDTINLCLQKFNSDTVKIQTIGKAMRIVRVLLFAHRDEDAVRFAQRFLDSVRNESEKNSDPTIRKKTLSDYKDGLSFMMQQYSSARPVRYDVVKQYYRRILSARAGDSSYYRIDAAVGIIDLAEALGDSVTKEEAAHLALRLNDSIPEEERPKLPNARNRLQSLAGLMVKATKYEALDSIAISTVAFNLWYANTVRRRVYGGPIETRENAQPKKLPELGGAFYYVANNMSQIRSAMGWDPTRARVLFQRMSFRSNIESITSVHCLVFVIPKRNLGRGSTRHSNRAYLGQGVSVPPSIYVNSKETTRKLKL